MRLTIEPPSDAASPVLAIYHASVKAFSRGKGHSATAAAAYRAGTRITDERTGVVHDYTRRSGVVWVAALVPPHAPAWAKDVASLWNAAERTETRINACVSRELEVSLPAELDAQQRGALALALGQNLVDRYGVAVLAAVHEPTKAGDARNYHVHLLFSSRRLSVDGFGEKTRELDDRTKGRAEVAHLRGDVARIINEHLAKAGRSVQVDHRSLREQAAAAATRCDLNGVVRLSRTPQHHRGRAATALERRGRRTERGAHQAAIDRDNQAVAVLGRGRVRALQNPRRGRAAVGARAARVVQVQPTRATSAPVAIGDSSLMVRAEGASARLLNMQATTQQKRMRQERDAIRAYIRALAEVSQQMARDHERLLRALRLSVAEAERLRQMWSTQPQLRQLVREALDAERDEHRHRADRPMIERRFIEERRRPHRPKTNGVPTRREWAERRRAERRAAAAWDRVDGVLQRREPSASEARWSRSKPKG